jgi:hypothetical protein
MPSSLVILQQLSMEYSAMAFIGAGARCTHWAYRGLAHVPGTPAHTRDTQVIVASTTHVSTNGGAAAHHAGCPVHGPTGQAGRATPIVEQKLIWFSEFPVLPVAQSTRMAAAAGADLKIETYPGVAEPAMIAFMFAQGYRARLGLFYDSVVPGGRLLRGFEFIHLGAGAI